MKNEIKIGINLKQKKNFYWKNKSEKSTRILV